MDRVDLELSMDRLLEEVARKDVTTRVHSVKELDAIISAARVTFPDRTVIAQEQEAEHSFPFSIMAPEKSWVILIRKGYIGLEELSA